MVPALGSLDRCCRESSCVIAVVANNDSSVNIANIVTQCN